MDYNHSSLNQSSAYGFNGSQLEYSVGRNSRTSSLGSLGADALMTWSDLTDREAVSSPPLILDGLLGRNSSNSSTIGDHLEIESLSHYSSSDEDRFGSPILSISSERRGYSQEFSPMRPNYSNNNNHPSHHTSPPPYPSHNTDLHYHAPQYIPSNHVNHRSPVDMRMKSMSSTMNMNPHNQYQTNSRQMNFAAPPERVYQVQFKRRIRFYVPGPNVGYIQMGDYVKVEADRGEDLGMITDIISPQDFYELRREHNLRPSNNNEEESAWDLKKIICSASTFEKNQLILKAAEEIKVIEHCRHLANNVSSLPMVIVDAEFQFDHQKLVIYYDSNIRIDFREFVRDVFTTYRTRIWMQQVNSWSPLQQIKPIPPLAMGNGGRPSISPTPMMNGSGPMNMRNMNHDLQRGPIRNQDYPMNQSHGYPSGHYPTPSQPSHRQHPHQFQPHQQQPPQHHHHHHHHHQSQPSTYPSQSMMSSSKMNHGNISLPSSSSSSSLSSSSVMESSSMMFPGVNDMLQSNFHLIASSRQESRFFN